MNYNKAAYRIELHNNEAVLPDVFKQHLKKLLVDRAGESFFAKLSIKELRIAIPMVEKPTKEDLQVEDVKLSGILKFYFSILLNESPTIKYKFTIAMDAQGRMIGEWDIPKLDSEKPFSLVPICEALDIANKDGNHPNKKINDINLLYDRKFNYLGWKITMGYQNQHQSNYKSYRMTINALTGIIIDRWDANVIKYDSPTHK